MKYPLGIQSFKDIREDGYLYMDKTAMVYDLAKGGKSNDRFHIRRMSLSMYISHQKQKIMKEQKYTPQPIDTSDVKLPEELAPLVEQMSKNVHEVWAASRISQGWTYGEQRNDELKTHPCLVPYEELPEVEKAYDRDTALGTLRLIMKMGFKISK